jgi:hypothetical protein
VRLADYLGRIRTACSLLDEMTAGDLDIRSRYEHFCRTLSDAQRLAYHRLAATSSPPFDHGTLMTALADLDRPDSVLESLIECRLLTVPNDEVSTHNAAYDMPAFAYLYGRELSAAAHHLQIA